MIATLYSHNKVLGVVDLSITDESKGVVSGKLSPTEDYFPLQQVFRRHQNNQHKEIIELRLNLELQNQWFIFPDKIYVEDFLGFEDKIMVYALGLDSALIENYFKRTSYLPFIEEPWYPLDLRGKIGLENELRNEIGTKSGENKNHALLNYNFSAFARHGPSDDVLFELSESNKYTFAMVHLTWKSKLEVYEDCPTTVFYKDFDEFKYFRMYPDRNEWEN